ncbi:MAG: winged helix-turn-helix domain-containing protein [Chitinophagaceae bacterium]
MSKSIRGLLKKTKSFTVNGSIWIECNGERYFGPGPVELLERINQTGSINQAAKQMQMSYKKAWEIINMVNTEAARPLVVTQTGGSSGGGSIITSEAKEIIAWHHSLRERFKAFLEKETEKLGL